MSTTTIKLGQTVRDKVSGFQGIAQSRTEFMTGNVQYSIQPPAKDGVMTDPYAFDAHNVEVVVGGASVPTIEPPADTGIKLGEKVKDIVTGITGIAIRRVTFLNGCVYYSIQTPYDAKTQKVVEEFLEWKRLDRVSVGVTATIAKKVEPVEGAKKTASRAPGGPSFRAPARG